MKSQSFRTHSEEETIALGRRIAGELPPGPVLLIGQLGAGKTTIAKGIVEAATGLAADEITSPTFTLIHQYEGKKGLAYHIDLYRLDESRQVEALGLEDLFASDALVLLEWAERFPALLPARRTEIRLQAISEDTREIEIRKLKADS